MKYFLILFLTYSAAISQADSFTVIRDGKEYLCQLKNPQPPLPPPQPPQPPIPPDPNGRLRCIETAYNGPFSRQESERICEGAVNAIPARCAIKAYNGPFSKEEAIGLCIAVRNEGPADCAIMAYNGPFSKEQSLRLCYGGTVQNAECAIRAYNGPYSKEEAIQMCRNNPHLILRMLTN